MGSARVRLGKAVTMPQMQDPVAQLAADLRTLLSARALENEKEIQLVFKAAVQEADEAMDQELKAWESKLVGKKRMQDVQKSADDRCWRAFENKLSAYHKWITTGNH